MQDEFDYAELNATLAALACKLRGMNPDHVTDGVAARDSEAIRTSVSVAVQALGSQPIANMLADKLEAAA